MPVAGPPLEEPIALHDILKVGLDTKPEADALVSRRKRWNWRELDDESNRLATAYLNIGLKPGDRIASLMPNRSELLIHYVACMKCGLVAMPLNYRYMAAEIDHALEIGGARLLLTHEERRSDLLASKYANNLPLGQVYYSDTESSGDRSFSTIVKNTQARDFVSPQPDDPAIIFFTSGSTGKPKGVCHSFETLGWICASAVKSFDMGPDDIMLPGGSASHVGGHHLSMMTLASAGCVVVPHTSDGDEILPLLREERPTKLWMLPTALYALTQEHKAHREDFFSVKACFSGGDKVSEALELEFTRLAGIAIDEDYGMTEIGIPTVTPPAALKVGSVGPLAPGYQALLRDSSGLEVPTGEPGQLWIKFPGNMVGYWNNSEATAATIVDGWLDTGDIMSIDSTGYLWFHGRKKQIIIHDGSNICPQEVEAALLEHDAVSSAGVVGVHDPRHGENVRAYITLKAGVPKPGTQELIKFARARVGYKSPEEIIVLAEMPLNATGKLDRVTLKKMATEAVH
ncbi:Long-chain-fatty-acid--CoA ligase [Halioglobus japonicus]|nr:Long-chain-fatty-acid--CoA ligase [Halioglobus japonicus]